MDNDMVCHIMEGEFKITKGDMEFAVKEVTCTPAAMACRTGPRTRAVGSGFIG